MPGQATVTIGSKQWACAVATTVTEVASGLSGVVSMSPGIGMLFDLGAEYSHVDIKMSEMLFPLDVIFINSNWVVVGVLRDVQPGAAAPFTGATKYFLEVNAGEASGVEPGDSVAVSGYQGFQLMDALFAMITLVIVSMMASRMIPR